MSIDEPSTPVLVVEEDLDAPLLGIQRAILEHPAAAQALFYALVSEGRRFAATAEGGELQERLRKSELIARARVLWDSITLRALEDDPNTVVPSAVLDALIKGASDAGMERVVETLFVDNFFGKAAERMITERPDDFRHRNLFLQVLLGILSWGEALERLSAPSAATEVDANDPVLLAVLGAAAIHRRVAGWAAATPPLARAEADDVRTHLKDVLR